MASKSAGLMPFSTSRSSSQSAARRAKTALSLGTGRIQIEKYCCRRGIVGNGEGAHPFLDEIFDVGVIAVVQPALAAKVLHQLAVERAMLAKVRVGHGKGVEVVVASSQIDRETDRDGRGFGRLGDDRDIQSARGSGRLELRREEALRGEGSQASTRRRRAEPKSPAMPRVSASRV